MSECRAQPSLAKPDPNQTFSERILSNMADLVRVGSLGKGGVGGVVKKVKVERPRPLKIGGGAHPELSLEDLLVVIEGVRKSLGVKRGGADGGGNFNFCQLV